MIQPDLSEFLEKAKHGNLIPVRKEIFADFETPVSAYCKIRKGSCSFLLESVEQAEIIGRYSFIGTDPRIVISSRGDEVTLTENGDASIRKLREGEDPLHVLQEVMDRFKVVSDPDLPPFFGGLVGYVGYDTVAFFENLNLSNADEVSAPDCLFVLADSVVAFDRVRQTLQIVVNAMVEGDPKAAHARAVEQIEDLEARLLAPVEVPTFGAGRTTGLSIQDNRTREDYCQAVRRAKDYIIAGDAFQIVLSLNRRMEIEGTPLDFYRALRRLNPSPYMFLLENE
jgi:anthranilate synthase component 1